MRSPKFFGYQPPSGGPNPSLSNWSAAQKATFALALAALLVGSTLSGLYIVGINVSSTQPILPFWQIYPDPTVTGQYDAKAPNGTISFTSTNCITVFNSAVNAMPSGGSIYFDAGFYYNTAITVPLGIHVTISSGARGITYTCNYGGSVTDQSVERTYVNGEETTTPPSSTIVVNSTKFQDNFESGSSSFPLWSDHTSITLTSSSAITGKYSATTSTAGAKLRLDLTSAYTTIYEAANISLSSLPAAYGINCFMTSYDNGYGNDLGPTVSTLANGTSVWGVCYDENYANSSVATVTAGCVNWIEFYFTNQPGYYNAMLWVNGSLIYTYTDILSSGYGGLLHWMIGNCHGTATTITFDDCFLSSTQYYEPQMTYQLIGGYPTYMGIYSGVNFTVFMPTAMGNLTYPLVIFGVGASGDMSGEWGTCETLTSCGYASVVFDTNKGDYTPPYTQYPFDFAQNLTRITNWVFSGTSTFPVAIYPSRVADYGISASSCAMLFKNDPRIRALVLGIPYDVPSYPEASQPAIPVLMVSGAIDPTAPTNSNALWEYGNITANVPKLLVEEVGQTHSSPITTIEGAKYIINWLNYWMIGNTTSYPIFFGSSVVADSGISRHWNANVG